MSENQIQSKDTKYQEDKKINIQNIRDIQTDILSKKPNSFPVEVFPAPIQDIVIETNKCLGFPIPFIISSIFWSFGLAIGNTRCVTLNGSKTSKANLWIIIVAHRGIGKSAPLEWAIKPFEALEAKYYLEYKNSREVWKNTSSDFKSDPPIRKKIIVDDYTIETLAYTHTNNPRGTGVVNDELIGWLKTILDNNSKNKGKWLSLWNGGKLDVIRMSREENFLPTTFIPVIGTTQPSKLKEFLTDDNIGDGLADRILFINAEDEVNKPFSKLILSNEVEASWHNIINRALEIELEYDEYQNPKSKKLTYSSEAKEYLLNWQEETVIFRNKKLKENPVINDYLRAYAKHDDYVQRFALILQIMDDVCYNRVSNEITLGSVKGAIKISNYFMRNFKSAFHRVKGFGVKNIKDEEKDFYDELPQSFTFSEAKAIGVKQGIHDSTVKRYLKNASLYGKAKRGHYYKQ